MNEAPKSFVVYRCGSCGHSTSEPYAGTEAELRAALDADDVPVMRIHRDCLGAALGIEHAVRTGRTIFDVLGSMPR